MEEGEEEEDEDEEESSEVDREEEQEEEDNAFTWQLSFQGQPAGWLRLLAVPLQHHKETGGQGPWLREGPTP